MIKAENLEKSYPKAGIKALKGLCLEVAPGEIFGLLGPNGAGKTTAISILAGIMKPDAGSITIDDISIFNGSAKSNQPAAKAKIGLVPQDIALYATLTAKENMRFFGRLYGLSGNILEERIEECLKFVGLQDRADSMIDSFSGGMKRRANIAAGILHRPKAIFLDEPTVGIDAQSRNMIFEMLESFKASNTAMIYTTHYMEEAQRLCDRIAVIDDGRIIAQGTPDDLVSKSQNAENLGGLFLELTGKKLRD